MRPMSWLSITTPTCVAQMIGSTTGSSPSIPLESQHLMPTVPRWARMPSAAAVPCAAY
jgi:hypothetical protein